MWQHSPRYTIVVYMQIVVPRSPVESFKLWLEQFSFMKEGCDIFFEPLEKVVRVSANYAYSSQKKNTLVRCIQFESQDFLLEVSWNKKVKNIVFFSLNFRFSFFFFLLFKKIYHIFLIVLYFIHITSILKSYHRLVFY